MSLLSGSSGFAYASWKGGFYPADAKPADFLRLYAERLPAVEVNASFYRIPSVEQLRGWVAATPPAFRFAVKASRRISHFGELELLPGFCERVHELGERLGPVLVQLPPSRPYAADLLARYLGLLDPDLRFAFEFRHRSWQVAEVDEALRGAGATRVGASDPSFPFVYLRLREPPYDEAAITRIAHDLRPALDLGRDVYCFFKHEQEPSAPGFAEQLLSSLGALGA
ncbi:MAG: DUF72 domain-containing protein [Gaiellaceae bacterium]